MPAADDVPARAGGRGRYTPLPQPRRWVHQVADPRTGQLHTGELGQPLTPEARAARLASLGIVLGPVFGEPAYRLTPAVPSQASPAAYLLAYALDFYSAGAGIMAWSPPRDYDASLGDSRDLHFQFAAAPADWCLLTLVLTGSAWPGLTGSIRVVANEGGYADLTVPFSGSLAQQTVEVPFSKTSDAGPELMMIVGTGIQSLEFSSATFGAAPITKAPGGSVPASGVTPGG